MNGRVILGLVLSLVCCQYYVSSKPYGAPESACGNMVPMHNVGPQSSKAPYKIEIDKSEYAPNELVEVTMSGLNGVNFEGFLIEARRVDPSKDTSVLIGTFSVPGGMGNEMKTSCNGKAMTHAKQITVSSRTFKWTAPSTRQGHLEFRATFVKDFSHFWINVKSKVLEDPNAAPLPSPNPAGMNPIKQIVTKGECGVTKGCFLYPAGCTEDTCEYLLTYRVNGDYVDFEMSSKTNGYIAAGFSYDDKMGSDSVIDCIYNNQPLSPRVVIQHSYNVDSGYNNQVIQNAKEGIFNATGYFFKDRLSCRFRRIKKITNNPQIYSLDKKYYVLLARGSSQGGIKARHDLNTLPHISAQPIDVAAQSSSGSKTQTYPLAKAHGCLMVLAWVFFASFGMLTARYYKLMWPNAGLCSEKVWFAVHRFCMAMATTLTCIGFILIFIGIGGYSYGLQGLPHRAHPILGIIVTILCILNPLIALCRPHPKDKDRPIFNWIHWAIGTIAHILAIVTMFIGVDLSKVGAPWYTTWFLVAFVIFHCCVELILEIHQCCTARRNHEKNEEYEMEKERRPRDYLHEPSPSGRFFKMFFLILHAVVVGALAIVLLLLIALGRDVLG